MSKTEKYKFSMKNWWLCNKIYPPYEALIMILLLSNISIKQLSYLDVLIEHIQELAPRCMLLADDIVLLGESGEELNGKLETWRWALEAYGFSQPMRKQDRVYGM
jgi:hypothetical protein